MTNVVNLEGLSDEQKVRIYAVNKAVDLSSSDTQVSWIIDRASAIEKYVLEGK